MVLVTICTSFIAAFVALIIIPLIFHLLTKGHEIKYGGIFSVVGPFYRIKYIIFLILLKIRKYRNESDSNKLFDIDQQRYHRMIEKPKKVIIEKDIDSLYFSLSGKMTCKENNEESNLDLVIRYARRNKRINEFWMILVQDNKPNLVHPACPDTKLYNCSASGWKSIDGLSVFCDRPVEKWTIKYHGWLKEDNEEGKAVHVNMKLCFRGFTNIIDAHKFTSAELTADAVAREPWSRNFFHNLDKFAENSQAHYEQYGNYSGNIIIDKVNSYELDNCKGFRDHSYGLRDWSQYKRYGVMHGYLESGACFSLGSLCYDNALTHVRYGYYVTPFGETRPITYHNYDLWKIFQCSPPKDKFTVDFYAGGNYHLEAKKFSEVNFTLKNGKTLIIERFMDFNLNGINGKGINEYCASGAVPRYKQPILTCFDFLDESNKEISDDFCLSLKEEKCRNRSQAGGKGCQLADLMRLQRNLKEINVPPGFLITIKSYKSFLQANPEIQEHLNDLVNIVKIKRTENIESLCNDIVLKFEEGEIPQVIQNDIITQLQKHFGNHWSDVKLAIRSSSAEEDSSNLSSAGQMATFLGIRGLEKILKMIKRCWGSQFTYRSISYRIRNCQNINSCMGIVVMEMIKSKTSGVLFTINPLNGDSCTMILNATYGLGEAVVSDKCNPDQFEIEKIINGSLKIRSRCVGSKNVRVDLVDDKIEDVIETDERISNELCLTDEVVLKISELGIQIEKCYGHACDIEWAECDGELYILQTRPITGLQIESEEDIIREFDSAFASKKECLTSSNIGEMMPMATTPLTLSLFGTAVDRSFKMILNKNWVLPQLISPQRFIVSYSNHLFINIHYASLLSAGNQLKVLFLALLGRNLEEPTEQDILDFTGPRSLFKRLYMVLVRILTHKGGQKETKIWEEKFINGYRIQSKKTSCLQMKVILDQVKDYYKCWYDTIRNTQSSAMWSLMLVMMLGSDKDWDNALFSKVALLLSTCPDVISADVPNSLRKISEIIKKDGELKNTLINESDESCSEWLNSARSKEAGTLFREFLKRHGHRCIREAEFRELSWRRSPEKLVSVIRVMVTSLPESSGKPKQYMTPDEAVDSLGYNFNFIKRKIIKWILVKARKGVALREWGKSISIEMCDAFKEAFSKLGELMATENIISDSDLIYYFTFDELISLLVDKTSNMSEIASTILKRRKVYEKQMKVNMPELCFGNPYTKMKTKPSIDSHSGGYIKISGLSVSLGNVSGPGRVLTECDEAKNIKAGEILIIPYIDIGWTPYFPLLAGLVTEKGSILSHGAVIAREYGIPCIVGCIDATKLFKTGNNILLNAHEGTVEMSNI